MTAAIDLLRCPACHRGSLSPADEAYRETHCDSCPARFAVRDGVVDLLPDAESHPGLAQRFMEAEPVVRVYESSLWRRSRPAAWALGIGFDDEQKQILDALGLHGACSVLDLACGPGIYTRALAHRLPHGRVVGLDISWPMLRHAAARAARERLGNITFVHGTAGDLPLRDASVDAVNCSGALHLFPDANRALAEIFRVLKPGARLTLAAVRVERRLVARVARRLTGLAPFSAAELSARLVRAGFVDEQRHHARRLWQIVSACRP